MGKLIDSDNLSLETFDSYSWFNNEQLEAIKKCIDDQPSAVVHCKECQFHGDRESNPRYCTLLSCDWEDDDFCSYGVRSTIHIVK